MAIKARIWWDEAAQAYLLSLVPDKNLRPFIAILKSRVPSGERDYDPKTNFWYLKEIYIEGVRALAQQVYGIASVSFTSRTVVEQARQSRPVGLPTTPIKQVFVEFITMVNEDSTQAISYEAAKRAYRRAAITLHPDRGGDPAKMARLNELWSRVEHEYYNK